MSHVSVCCNGLVVAPPASVRQQLPLHPITLIKRSTHRRQSSVTASAGKSGGLSLNSLLKKCQICKGKEAIQCPGCKGSGKNKKDGNMFERWKCYRCQGFGFIGCPSCGKGGLTPEQRGER